MIELWKGDYFFGEVENIEEILQYDLEEITSIIFIHKDEEYGKDVIWEKDNGWSEAV